MSTSTAIRVEKLGKLYRVGTAKERHETLAAALFGGLRAPLRNLREIRQPGADRGEGENAFWALDDVSFSVPHGQVLGVVGRNGAGKSTLLKVLSRVVAPTRGRAVVRGRVGSLLEVGTGFHPELTGRDNVYLNGSILGMDRAYIDRRFEEIVEFAGVARFIDTPVKRYSSGMYLRLAFAVAAHLEPEILIVDEVLAVGDAEFQRKCLGRMGEVSREGRTILFVSHNMAAVRVLCDRAILLRGGRLEVDADVETVIAEYLSDGNAADGAIAWEPEAAPQAPEVRLVRGWVSDVEGNAASLLDCRRPFRINVEYDVLKPVSGLRVGCMVQTSEAIPMFGSNDPMAWPTPSREPGRYVSSCTVPGFLLNSGQYAVSFGADRPPYTESLIATDFCVRFTVADMEGHGTAAERLPGVVRPDLTWNVRARMDAPASA